MYEQELQNLGLSEKESKVYLTSLRLGPDTVQNIAKESGINRATTYVQIDSLKEKGLMSEFEKGKKTYFVAESPEILSRLISKEEVSLNFKKQELTRVLPDLAKFFIKSSGSSKPPKIRFFEGEDGVSQIRSDFLKIKNDTIVGFINLDKVLQKFAKNQDEYTKKRVDRKIQSNLLYVTTKPTVDNPSDPKKLRVMKRIKSNKFPFDSDITVYGNKVAFISYSSNTIGVIVDSKEIADTIRAIFYIIWDNI